MRSAHNIPHPRPFGKRVPDEGGRVRGLVLSPHPVFGEGDRGRVLTVLTALFLLAPYASAQFEIDWWTIDDGSTVLTDGTFELRGTIGQPDAEEQRTNAMSGMGGFWSLDYAFCLADLTTTGAGIGDPGFGVADGQVTGTDINFYVNAWVAGCP